ncbi:hypothetical protein [Dactylosporangium sp. CA-233914]
MDRRAQQAAIDAADRLSRRTYWLTVANTLLAVAAVVVAIIAIVLQR